MSPKVTIVIINWNGKHLLEKFMPSVVGSTYDNYEILLMDNGSKDESSYYLHEHFPMVKVIELGENYGFTGGNNKAIPYIDSPYTVLLNSDVEVTPGWIEPLVELMESDHTIAAVQPKIRAYDDKNSFEYAGAAGGYIDAYGYPFCRGRIFDTLESDAGQYDTVADVFWATGACMFIRSSVIQEIGLFEEAFFAHMEEIDFCWRAHNHGYRIMCHPGSMVYHVGGGTLHKNNPRKTYYNLRNSLAMMYKNLPAVQVLPKIFIRLLLDAVYGLKALKEGDWNTIKSIIRAHWHFFFKIPFWHRRRKKIYRKITPGRIGVGYYPGSIVWQYFYNKIKRFSQLKMPAD